MFPPDFAKVLEAVRRKAPKAISLMAHHERGRDKQLSAAQQALWEKAYSFVSCDVPPPPHPIRPSEGLCMRFSIENVALENPVFYLSDAGALTDDPAAARFIERGWKYEPALRTELRAKGLEGIDALRTLLQGLGIPREAIYDNSDLAG